MTSSPGATQFLQDQSEHLRARRHSRSLADLYGPFDNLPGMRGLWTAASVNEAGLMYDRSDQLRHLTLNGNPTVNIYDNLVPYWDLDGTGDFFRRTDEAGLDILGTETMIAAALRGLTVGGWFWFDVLGAQDELITKHGAAGNRSWRLASPSTNQLRWQVSPDGTTLRTVDSTIARTIDGWLFVVGRFIPSTERAIYVNGTWTKTTSSVDAALFNSTATLDIGADATGAGPLDGRCALAFLCAAALPDVLVKHLYQESHWFFDT